MQTQSLCQSIFNIFVKNFLIFMRKFPQPNIYRTNVKQKIMLRYLAARHFSDGHSSGTFGPQGWGRWFKGYLPPLLWFRDIAMNTQVGLG